MRKKPEQTAGTVVYIGPTIHGVANQNTFYTNGIPTPLAEAIKSNPPLGGLVIPLEQLPAAMAMLRGGNGNLYHLYRLVQAKL